MELGLSSAALLPMYSPGASPAWWAARWRAAAAGRAAAAPPPLLMATLSRCARQLPSRHHTYRHAASSIYFHSVCLAVTGAFLTLPPGWAARPCSPSTWVRRPPPTSTSWKSAIPSGKASKLRERLLWVPLPCAFAGLPLESSATLQLAPAVAALHAHGATAEGPAGQLPPHAPVCRRPFLPCAAMAWWRAGRTWSLCGATPSGMCCGWTPPPPPPLNAASC